jgi:hypothetical protein
MMPVTSICRLCSSVRHACDEGQCHTLACRLAVVNTLAAWYSLHSASRCAQLCIEAYYVGSLCCAADVSQGQPGCSKPVLKLSDFGCSTFGKELSTSVVVSMCRISCSTDGQETVCGTQSRARMFMTEAAVNIALHRDASVLLVCVSGGGGAAVGSCMRACACTIRCIMFYMSYL